MATFAGRGVLAAATAVLNFIRGRLYQRSRGEALGGAQKKQQWRGKHEFFHIVLPLFVRQ